MSSTPTFYPSRDELKKTLRLEHVVVGSPSDLVFDEAVRTVRVSLLARLGISKISTINTYSYVEDPQTTGQILRFTARTAEFYLVKRQCLLIMSARQLDSFGDVLRAWNFEGIIREISAFDMAAVLGQLQSEADKSLDILDSLGVNLGSVTLGHASAIENASTDPRPIPGGTAFPSVYWGS
jgi:hypothetical protein